MIPKYCTQFTKLVLTVKLMFSVHIIDLLMAIVECDPCLFFFFSGKQCYKQTQSKQTGLVVPKGANCPQVGCDLHVETARANGS